MSKIFIEDLFPLKDLCWEIQKLENSHIFSFYLFYAIYVPTFHPGNQVSFLILATRLLQSGCILPIWFIYATTAYTIIAWFAKFIIIPAMFTDLRFLLKFLFCIMQFFLHTSGGSSITYSVMQNRFLRFNLLFVLLYEIQIYVNCNANYTFIYSIFNEVELNASWPSCDLMRESTASFQLTK